MSKCQNMTYFCGAQFSHKQQFRQERMFLASQSFHNIRFCLRKPTRFLGLLNIVCLDFPALGYARRVMSDKILANNLTVINRRSSLTASDIPKQPTTPRDHKSNKENSIQSPATNSSNHVLLQQKTGPQQCVTARNASTTDQSNGRFCILESDLNKIGDCAFFESHHTMC